jgi:hypothetical protein
VQYELFELNKSKDARIDLVLFMSKKKGLEYECFQVLLHTVNKVSVHAVAKLGFR